MEKRGIDISYAQTSVDWAKVKAAGVEFAMVRAGYGRELSQKDSMFESHYAGAKSVGIFLRQGCGRGQKGGRSMSGDDQGQIL